jgi:hypothetical protein
MLFSFCSNAYNIIAADDNLFAGVICIIQLLSLLLPFTLSCVDVSMYVRRYTFYALFVLHASIFYRHFFPFCSNAYNIIAADDNLFAGVLSIIQLFSIVLPFTLSCVDVSMYVRRWAFYSRFILHLSILSLFLSVLFECIEYHCSGRQSVCWCFVRHSTVFYSLAFYTSLFVG